MTTGKLYLSAVLLGMLCVSEAYGLAVKVQNDTGKDLYLFFRSADANRDANLYYKTKVSPTPKGTHQEISFDEAEYNIVDSYDVIAAQSDGDPDRKLLGGKCGSLSPSRIPHILVQAPGVTHLKTTCTVQ